ncbi:MAG: UDP-glucuronic acid decarboxylase family protein [Pseudomonadota bacterium]
MSTTNNSGRRVLVTGGAGFVGSHLCDRLLEQGCEVIALDNLSTGRLSHIEHLIAHPRFTLLRHDVTVALPELPLPLHEIYNLACPASPAYYLDRPVQTNLSSVLGMWRLLELARSTGARVLQASTSEAYGDPQEHPQREGYWGHVNPVGPRACYDEGKRCAEAMCVSYNSQCQVSVRIARIFNTYGPRLPAGDGRVVSNFISQALRGEPLTVFGEGTQTRSFCYVDDTVDGLMRLMASDEQGPVNIGNPGEFTVLALAQQVLDLTGSRSPLVHKALPVDDPVRRRPDIGLAERALGWRPRVDLRTGLQRTIAHLRKEVAAAPVDIKVPPEQLSRSPERRPEQPMRPELIFP